MNAILKFFLIVGLVASVGVLVNVSLQSTFAPQINNAFVFFLVAMYPMDFIIPMHTVYLCIQILGNFLYGLAIFITIRWLVHLFSK